ncbi:MAG: hypothetical protein UGE22_01875 [Clostridia bacterium]|jgi:hypothetical protein|nr:hypothetical protein [Clostridia bacterium]
MKKIIAVIISIIIIITIVLIILITSNNNNVNNNEEGTIEGKSDIITITNGMVVEYPDNRTNSFTAKRLAEEYINYIVGERKEKLINIISNKYVQKENITIDNVLEKVKDANVQYSQNYKVIVNNMYVIKESINLESYLVDLTYCNLDANKNYEIKLIVQIDIENLTFCIMPYKYIQKLGYDKLKLGDTCTIEHEKIEKNQYNIYKMTPISKNSTAERYFNIFLENLKYDMQKSYELLDTQYKQNKFKNINEYIQYVQNNKLQENAIKSYNVYTYDDYNQYVCIDNQNRYYIFNEKGIMNFTVILDTYTIDLPEFTEKYTKASDEEKVLLNIQKCFTAINDKDYRYVYNKLDNTFKANNFKTLADFEKYINANFFEKNKISASNARKQSEVYLYDIKISNIDGTSSITKTFVMQLKENTDFVMSFGV